VLLGSEGVLAGAQPGSIWIDMSTSTPALAQRIAAAAAAKEMGVLDAPVTGAADGALAGTLTIFVGGDRALYERCLPVFRAMGRDALYLGPLGAGYAVKLLTNLLWFINAAAIGEALLLGARSGVELRPLWEAIKLSAGNSWVAEHDVPAIFRGDYDPSFTLNLCCKDLRLITDLGRDTGTPLELGALAEQIFIRARTQYGGELGELHVVKLLEDATGTALRA
jgi:3-hydroxyisobutyrate dehydrogenase